MSLILDGSVGVSDIDGTAATPAIRGTDTNTGIFFGSDIIGFSEGGTEAMRITSAGNLGLGTTNPSADYFTQARLLQITGTNSAAIKFERTDATARKWEIGLTSGGNFDITDTVASTSEPRFRIDTSGNVGIGTSSPTDSKLHIAGYNGGSTYPIRMTSSNSGVEWAFETGGSAAGSSFLAFRDMGNSAERMRITSDGNVGIGTTSPATNKLVASQSASSNCVYMVNTNATTAYGMQIAYSGRSPNSTGEEFIYIGDTGPRFIVRSNGGIANYSANNVNLSDAREKTNIELAANYLDKICAIPVKTFNYIDQNMEEDGGLTLGVVAQDVKAVAPELVMESNWANKDETPKMRLSIYQTDLQYALMKSIQELNAKVDAQALEITNLKRKLT
jgi:hypothetical protein